MGVPKTSVVTSHLLSLGARARCRAAVECGRGRSRVQRLFRFDIGLPHRGARASFLGYVAGVLTRAAAALVALGLVVGGSAVLRHGSGDDEAEAAPAAPAPGVGSPGIGDPYFPLDGNGGINVLSYAVHDRYRFGSHRLSGHTVVTLRTTAAAPYLRPRLPAPRLRRSRSRPAAPPSAARRTTSCGSPPATGSRRAIASRSP